VFLTREGELRMSSIKVLKNLKAIYWRALDSKKWKVALEAVERQARYEAILERQARYKAMFEKQSPPSQALADIRRMRDMTEEQLRDCIAALEKFHPHLKKLDSGLEYAQVTCVRDRLEQQLRGRIAALKKVDPDLKKVEYPPPARA
jgi:uncharacterized membrane protein YgaE (UPF0421/DUF939 family)